MSFYSNIHDCLYVEFFSIIYLNLPTRYNVIYVDEYEYVFYVIKKINRISMTFYKFYIIETNDAYQYVIILYTMIQNLIIFISCIFCFK